MAWELARTRQAYGRFVPQEFLRLMGFRDITDVRLGDYVERPMTILFADIAGFTTMSEQMDPAEIFGLLNSYLGEMEPIVAAHHGFIDKFIGDAIMALFPGEADDAVHAAGAMMHHLAEYNTRRASSGHAALDIGIGINTGIVALGTVGGASRMEGTVVSDAVNLASRIESLTRVYRAPVLITENTLYALHHPQGVCARFVDRIRVKGKRQPQSVYEVFDSDPEPLRKAKQRTLPRFEEGVAHYHLRNIGRARSLLDLCVREAPGDLPAAIYRERCDEFDRTGLLHSTGELDGRMQWRDEFTLGVGIVDEQHRKLLDAMNRFPETVKGGRAGDIECLMSFLESYAAEHFRDEEELMERYSYPLVAEHKVAHRRFVDCLALLRRDVESGIHDPLFLVFRAQVFLLDWFAHHSTKTDRHYARFLRQCGAPEAMPPTARSARPLALIPAPPAEGGRGAAQNKRPAG